MNKITRATEHSLYSLRSIVLIIGASLEGFTADLGRLSVVLACYVTLVSTACAATSEILFSCLDDCRVRKEWIKCTAAAAVAGLIGAGISAVLLLAAGFDTEWIFVSSAAVAAGSVGDARRMLRLRLGSVNSAVGVASAALLSLAIGLSVGEPLYGWLASAITAAVMGGQALAIGNLRAGVEWLRCHQTNSLKSAFEALVTGGAGQASTPICAVGLSLTDAGLLRTVQAFFGPATVGVAGLRLGLVASYYGPDRRTAGALPRRPTVKATALAIVALTCYATLLQLVLSRLGTSQLFGVYVAGHLWTLVGIQVMLGISGVLVPAYMRLCGRFGLVLAVRCVTAFVGVASLALGAAIGSLNGLVLTWIAGSCVSAMIWWSVMLRTPSGRFDEDASLAGPGSGLTERR